MIYNILFVLLFLINVGFSYYEVGDVISEHHQNVSFSTCYQGNGYQNEDSWRLADWNGTNNGSNYSVTLILMHFSWDSNSFSQNTLFSNLYEEYLNNPYVNIVVALLDPDQPYSCYEWGSACDNGCTQITSGIGNNVSDFYNIYDLFGSNGIVPSMVWIDHEMKVYKKANYEGLFSTSLNIVNMLEDCGSLCNPDFYGCTNNNASNYNSSATVDDGSCIFSVESILEADFNIGDTLRTEGFISGFWNSGRYNIVWINSGSYQELKLFWDDANYDFLQDQSCSLNSDSSIECSEILNGYRDYYYISIKGVYDIYNNEPQLVINSDNEFNIDEIHSCTDEFACNYDKNATVNIFEDCLYFNNECDQCKANDDVCVESFGTEQTLDVITWNIKYFPSSYSTVLRLQEIIPVLNADIIAVQEISSQYYFDQLISLLPDYDGYSSYSYQTSRLGFIYKNNLNPNFSALSNLYTQHRIPLLMTLNWQGQELNLINLHLACCDEGEDSRKDDLKNLKEFIDNEMENKNVIVLGDMNDNLNDNIYDNVFQPFIQDSLNYLFTDLDIAYGNSNLWSFPNYPSHIDHILITNELFNDFEHQNSSIQTLIMDTSIDNSNFKNSSYNRLISDHRAVGLNLFLNENEGCIDTLAVNFDLNAGVDDGSCIYSNGITDSLLIGVWEYSLLSNFSNHNCEGMPDTTIELSLVPSIPEGSNIIELSADGLINYPNVDSLSFHLLPIINVWNAPDSTYTNTLCQYTNFNNDFNNELNCSMFYELINNNQNLIWSDPTPGEEMCLQIELARYDYNGCTDPTACNYESIAEFDDGSCEFYLDCNGVCGGMSEMDYCGECDNNPNNDCTIDCPENIIDGCSLPDNSLYLTPSGSLLYNSLYNISGFELSIDGSTFKFISDTPYYGGDALNAGFQIMATNDNMNYGTFLLGFTLTGSYIQAGCGTLINLYLENELEGIDYLLFSNTSGETIELTVLNDFIDGTLECCGDGICNGEEDENSCLEDCGESDATDATSSQIVIFDNDVYIYADGYVGGIQMTLTHGEDFYLDLTEDALIADYNTSDLVTTLIVIAPESEKLFDYIGDFVIVELIVTNSQDYISSELVYFQIGDVNYDNSINVLDVVSIVNYIIGNLEPNMLEFLAADYNSDGILDVLDAVLIVNIIMNNQ